MQIWGTSVATMEAKISDVVGSRQLVHNEKYQILWKRSVSNSAGQFLAIWDVACPRPYRPYMTFLMTEKRLKTKMKCQDL